MPPTPMSARHAAGWGGTLTHLFGLPGARNALCGMAAAQDRPQPAALVALATCQRCLSAPLVERH